MTCEHVYEKDKMTCMDVSIHVDSASNTDSLWIGGGENGSDYAAD